MIPMIQYAVKKIITLTLSFLKNNFTDFTQKSVKMDFKYNMGD